MQLNVLEQNSVELRAGYDCPCGCTPSVTYRREGPLVEEGCCCGNHIAIGPRASASLVPTPGFRLEAQALDAPWGDRLEAAWLVGPSVHGPAGHHDAREGHHGHNADQRSAVVDPVCGMTVEPEAARSKGLHLTHNGVEYFFCGKGCKLEFGDGPDRFLDPEYVPSM